MSGGGHATEVDALVEGVVRVDASGRPEHFSARAVELLGHDPEAALAEVPIGGALVGTAGLLTGNVAATGADGRRRWLDYRIAVHRADGTVLGATVAVLDVTAERARARALTEANEHFREIFDGATIGMAVLDRHGNVVTVNPALAKTIGRGTFDLIGVPFARLGRPEDAEELGRHLRQVLSGVSDGFHSELPLVTADGGEVWAQLDATVLKDADGAPALGLVQLQDASRRRAHQAELERLADHDVLTGLLNRRGFARELRRQLDRAARYGADGALLVLDLDDFKRVNDTLGHEAGDRLLRNAAVTLRGRLRESDAVARLGGDEFAVLVPHGGPADGEALAHGLLAALRAAPPVANVGGVRLSASIGVVAIDPDLTPEQLLARADLAMYEAKQGGRDAVVRHMAGTATSATTTERIAALAQVRGAVRAGRLRLLAQPIVNPATGRIELYELLLRMVDERGGLLPPDAFMHMAERFDLIQEIDRWVVAQAARLLTNLDAPAALSVNVSAKSLAGGDLTAAIADALAATGADPSRLVFELTETSAAGIADVRRFATRVTALGCRLAIDDFGAGYGSFQYLRHLPFDYLKIDGQFVTGGPDSPTDALIVDTVRDLAHGLGKRVIAEFVSDAALLEWVSARGVDLVQGFHLGRPFPVEDGFAAPAPA